MVICGNYMHAFSVSKDKGKKIRNGRRRKEVIVGKVTVQFCLKLIIKELKISVEQDRVLTCVIKLKRPSKLNLGFFINYSKTKKE